KMARLTVCLSALLVLLVALVDLGPMRLCCTEYNEHPIPIKMLKHYRIQKDTDICNINAVIFKTVRDRRVCGNPDSKWVQDGINHDDAGQGGAR
uniref:Chemokine interleukin-8-like domain-containing protein n=1 Tax=Myripristis murdjan TaxID=586833 RepID=A0A667X5M5_9TELE